MRITRTLASLFGATLLLAACQGTRPEDPVAPGELFASVELFFET